MSVGPEDPTAVPEADPIQTAQAAAKAAVASEPVYSPYVFLIGILAFLYRTFAWQNLPGDTKTRWIITGGLVVLLGIGIIFGFRRQSRRLEALGNYIIILFVIMGASALATYFDASDRNALFKLFAVAYFTFLPAWLYLQFIATRGKTVWEEYVLNLFRLHVDRYAHLPEPPLQSLFHRWWVDSGGPNAPPDNIYKKKFEALYGPPENLGVFRAENMFPVVLASVLIAVGWIIVVMPPAVTTAKPLLIFVNNGGGPAVPFDALRFGFLGAYFYVLQMLVRRYFQNDLRTHAFVNATMRIIVVFLLVWVVSVALPAKISPSTQYALAFMIGVFPQIGLQVISETLKLGLKLVVKSLEHPYPLSNLDGLSVWYESRLLEEGIEDMQNLATCNLVDAMLNTRIPIERLVDWVDQSLLAMHLGTDEEERRRLRGVGIRTATDLFEAYANDDAQAKSLDQRFDSGKLRIVIKTMTNEPNLYHVQEWRAFFYYISKDSEAAMVTSPLAPQPPLPSGMPISGTKLVPRAEPAP